MESNKSSCRWSKSGGGLEIFAERLLRLNVLITVALIKGVRAVADYVGSQSNRAAAFFPSPALAPAKKMPANSLRTKALVDNQSANFGSRLSFHTHADRKPPTAA